MSSANFSEYRRNTFQNNFILRSSSSVKKRPLVPLDFDKIKKEIEEADKNDNSFNFSSETADENIEINNGSEENIVHEQNISMKPLDNSFDLDFSTLSLHSPVKKDESAIEPCVIKKMPTQKEGQVRFDNFMTPNIKTAFPPKKIHCSIPRNSVTSSASKIIIKNPEIVQNNIVHPMPRDIHDNTFSKLTVNNTEYIIIKLLGRGGSSNVYQCFCLEKKMFVAIKCVSLENSTSAQGFVNEVELLHRLQNCDRIIKMYDYQILEEQKKLLVVLEKGGEDFATVIKKLDSQKMNISLDLLIFFWTEMLQAVKQIHSHGVIHSDLKPSNFLWGDKGLNLIDFGIASCVQTDMTSVIKTVPEGSCNYISPEALNNINSSPGKSKFKVHFKSDVWSLGCILYQLVYKRTPFQHIKVLWAKMSYIVSADHNIEYPEANWIPSKILNTIKKCLQYNVKFRPSVNELIEELEEYNVSCNV